MPVLQSGLRLFPTSSKGVVKMNIFETDTVVTQKVDLKQCWVTEALFLRRLDKIFSFTAELEDLESLSVAPDER